MTKKWHQEKIVLVIFCEWWLLFISGKLADTVTVVHFREESALFSSHTCSQEVTRFWLAENVLLQFHLLHKLCYSAIAAHLLHFCAKVSCWKLEKYIEKRKSLKFKNVCEQHCKPIVLLKINDILKVYLCKIKVKSRCHALLFCLSCAKFKFLKFQVIDCLTTNSMTLNFTLHENEMFSRSHFSDEKI